MDDLKTNEMLEEVIPTTYTLRPLRDEDLYPMLGVIAKVFPDELSEAFVNVACGA